MQKGSLLGRGLPNGSSPSIFPEGTLVSAIVQPEGIPIAPAKGLALSMHAPKNPWA